MDWIRRHWGWQSEEYVLFLSISSLLCFRLCPLYVHFLWTLFDVNGMRERERERVYKIERNRSEILEFVILDIVLAIHLLINLGWNSSSSKKKAWRDGECFETRSEKEERNWTTSTITICFKTKINTLLFFVYFVLSPCLWHCDVFSRFGFENCLLFIELCKDVLTVGVLLLFPPFFILLWSAAANFIVSCWQPHSNWFLVVAASSIGCSINSSHFLLSLLHNSPIESLTLLSFNE